MSDPHAGDHSLPPVTDLQFTFVFLLLVIHHLLLTLTVPIDVVESKNLKMAVNHCH